MDAVIGTNTLDSLYAPRSIAVIGVNDNEWNLGYGVLRSLDNSKYEGPVYPISLRLDSIRGLKAYRTVHDIEQVPELAVVALPAERVNPVADEIVAAGVPAMLVLSAGFAESGYIDRQERLRASISGTRARIGGPNCAGYANFAHHAVVSSPCPFGPESPRPRVGPVGIVSQSGGVGFHLMRMVSAAGLGLSCQISTGNEVDVDVSAAAMWLLEKPEIRVVLGFCETITRVDRFIDAALRAAQLDKPLVVLKGARTAASQRAARSHTASLAGSAAVFDAVCAQYGVHVVDSFQDMLNFARIFSDGRRTRGRNAGVITGTGGMGVLASDALAMRGLSVPELSADEQNSLREAIGAEILGSLKNPIDVGTGGGETFPRSMRWIVQNSPLDVVIPVTSNDPGSPQHDQLRDAYRSTDKPIAVLSTESIYTRPIASLVEQDIPVFTDPAGLGTAVAALVHQSERKRPEAWGRVEPGVIDRLADVQHVLARSSGRQFALENDAAEILRLCGIPVADSLLVTSADEAAAAAEALKGQVALKVMSYAIPHKSDIGGVMLGIEGPDAVRAGFKRLTDAVADRSPAARIEGVLVQRMIPARLEMSCGVERDETFGPVVMVSLGGTLIEIVAASAIVRPPFNPDQARSAIAGMLGGRLVTNSRGLRSGEVVALAEVMTKLGDLAVALPEVVSIDVNPLRVTDGQVWAVDALIERQVIAD